MDDKVLVILNVYRRPETLLQQHNALMQGTMKPNYIWIWQNRAPGKPIRVDPPPRCVMVSGNFNFIYHGRFALGLLAQRFAEYILFIDDDMIPGTRFLENCLASIKQNPGLYVGVGTRLNAEDHQGEKRGWVGWRDPYPELVEVDYGGHAWFLKTDWLRYLWAMKPYSLTNAEDIQLSAALQIYAGIPTYVPPTPPDQPEMWCNTVGYKYGNNSVASHKHPPIGGTSVKDWFAERRNAEKAMIEIGWQPMYMRLGVDMRGLDISRGR